ncbi:NAD-dependent epimerase/dehydratase family protein [Streptoalloteichus hindustanus]|uniref:UDP-glucose 4-epimerase n=1 Tax=Streptoalloteichus hindustanus TaxID=2017 RepID=Q2MEY1_STRHI|nr:NAD-dependent epimerase/dehydratase family protein [Streptoalloteichus hindustanus]CAI47643.1 putative tobramycin/apramycin biosynthetic oxidoreductase [Streptoalloteichus hindustanus]SHG39209.1 UDP-glucose 4-epimerase [Streptoalloteichus hindustanus]
MRIFVTGAAGYVGQAVLARLLAAGHDVTAVGHRTPVGWPAGTPSRQADLTDAPAVLRALDGAEAVCHLAGLTRVRGSGVDVDRYYRVNVVGTLNVLDALVARHRAGDGPARLVFLSSGAVYGRTGDAPVREDHPTLPTSAYGATKLAAEQAVGWYAGTGALSAVSLRLFTAAGSVRPGCRPDDSTLVARALSVAAGENAVLPVNGDGSTVRDFVHVADVADAVARAVEAPARRPAEVVNLGAVAASVREVVAAVERVTGRRVPVAHGPANSADQPWLAADTGAARELLGWAPTRSSLERMIEDQWRVGGAGR